MKLNQSVAIIAPKRTAIGKVAGSLAPVHPKDLMASSIKATLGEGKIDASDLQEVVIGNVLNAIGNIGRVAALEANIPQEVPAITVDRQCASSMEAASIAATKIAAGLAEAVLAGGVESASQAPWLFEKTDRPYSYSPPKPYKVRFSTEEIGDPPMGETAEILADEYKITREEMDRFSAQSHQRAGEAVSKGFFNNELLPVSIPQRKGDPVLINTDECIRADSTEEILGKLRPVFRKDGRVTAGNSSPINDGASSAVMASMKYCEKKGIKPAACLKDIVTVGLDPKTMGMGPALAIPALLERNGLKQDDIDLYEINEAFAAQILAVNKVLNIPEEKLNIGGGAIAIGHPLGATGMRLMTTLIGHLNRLGLKRGVASLCVGGGQGMAVLIEVDGS